MAGIISFLAVPFAFGTAAKQARGDEIGATLPPRPEKFSALLQYPTMRKNMVATLALLATTDILVAFLPVLGEDKGVPPVIIGILLAVRGAASIVSRLLLPALLARWSRAALVVVSLAGAGSTLALVPWLLELSWVAAALLALCGFFLGLGQPITMVLVAQTVPRASRGSSTCPPPAWQSSRASRPSRRGGCFRRSGRAQRGPLDVLRSARSRVRTLAEQHAGLYLVNARNASCTLCSNCRWFGFFSDEAKPPSSGEWA
ncbi:MFS transporter [Pseudarthrobacter oxydans]|uniref:MFS transporter n=1 Tax=Pseudarthrobacter oxydans TaxID=1671 RepID=UPI003D2B9EAB